MKNLPGLCLLLTGLIACQKVEVEQVDGNAYPQTWQLVRYSGSIPNSSKTGADLPMQETYVFQADSSFLKTRRQDGQVTEASGVFSLKNLLDGRYLILTYATASPLIGACTLLPQETLALKGDDTLANTWLACDGPGLEYKKVKATSKN